ncbi:MAG: C25 family cysteine peptidase [Dissulfuribacterales bacterium]
MKIETSENGIYRLTGNDFTNANVTISSIDPETFRMFHKKSEIRITVVSGGDGVFDPNDFIEFYAKGIDNQYTGIDVYWLYWGSTISGLRIPSADGSVSGSLSQITSFQDQLVVEENHIMWSDTPGAPDSDYWFWEKFTTPLTKEYLFDLPSPVQNTSQASITVYFQGRSKDSANTDHHTIIALNDLTIGDERWSGDLAFDQIMVVSQNLLQNRSNRLRIEFKEGGAAADVIYFNRIEVKYQRLLKAVDNQLKFSLSQNDPVKVTVSGFGSQYIKIYDITDPDSIKKLSGIDIQSDQSQYTITFAHSDGEKIYLAFTPNAVNTPDRIAYKKPVDLKTASNSADYILITADEFMPALEKLCELRRRQGMRVKMVDIEDIYDEFTFGLFDPEAIRMFLQYAYNNWEPPAPQYVLLAGDANLDYRDYYKTGKQNIVPVYLDKTYELGLTPSDNHYGCVAGNDPVPELYIGRIPGDSMDTVSGIVNKLILYESTRHDASQSVLFVADDEETTFESLNDNLARYLPPSIVAEKVYTRRYDNLNNATQDIQGFMDQGMLVTNFVGHGDLMRWGAEPFGGGDFIFEPDDISDLTNKNKLTFVIALDCLNGYFSQSFHYSLAEEWVMAPEKGAVACFAPSGLSNNWENEFLSDFIFSSIFLEDENSLGTITIQSKIDTYLHGASDKILISLNLIGDPATRLAINRDTSDLVTIHTITADAGAGGAIFPSGEILAFDDSSQTYTITPSNGYKISSVSVDGVSQEAISEYTFDHISADHRISALFESETEPDSGGGGGGGCFVSSIKFNEKDEH